MLHVIWMHAHNSIAILHGQIYDTSSVKLQVCEGGKYELEHDTGRIRGQVQHALTQDNLQIKVSEV
jgi:hypothetical protein